MKCGTATIVEYSAHPSCRVVLCSFGPRPWPGLVFLMSDFSFTWKMSTCRGVFFQSIRTYFFRRLSYITSIAMARTARHPCSCDIFNRPLSILTNGGGFLTKSESELTGVFIELIPVMRRELLCKNSRSNLSLPFLFPIFTYFSNRHGSSISRSYYFFRYRLPHRSGDYK